MATEIDLRDRPAGEYRSQIDDALGETRAGEEFRIVADRDVVPHLARYQIERGRALEWEHERPDGDPRRLRVRKGEPLGEGERAALDVRDLAPQRRHEALLETVDRLEPDEGFVLVNDHDPKPLYHEFRSMHGDVIGWEYASRGSGEWRVEVVKTGESDADGGDVLTRYDLHEIPPAKRHGTIHHRFGMIPVGETMELVAAHEPRPLYREFRAQYGDGFEWNVVEDGSERCRVRVTKTAADGSGSDDEGATAPQEGKEQTTATEENDEDLEVATELDVRDLPPAQRHERIFDAYAALDRGTGFVLVNDHDPKPLYHQFEAEAGPEFRWEYRKREPGEFRVLMGKADAGGDAPLRSEQTETPF